MTRTTQRVDDLGITLPITQAACKMAERFAHQQPNSTKAEQVRLNTLAVWVVNEYLQLMEIPTNRNVGDSWNPIMQLCSNVADLEITSVGRLECRPVKLNEQTCFIPPETWEDRVGYVVVQVDESLHEAHILGFMRSVHDEFLPLHQLQPLEALIDRIAQLQASPAKALVNLSQWFIGQVDAGWQTVEALRELLDSRPNYAFRGSVTTEESSANQQSQTTKRAKLIDLGIQIAHQPLMLIVEISPEENKTSIRLQLHPTTNQVYLPEGVKLTVLDESGAVFLEAQARSADNYIQLQFRGDIQEQFSVEISLNDMSVREQFMI
ncbi:DUF1822 family protein [Nostoc sp. FACHB-87]|uniref:DUF1822 family protein n=1 Tax=Nostocaceae TaxID=1162 RepID=UPI00168A1950|nr:MULTISPECIES: DUF1822 family protein [Nostocaceae]MBD2301311.1 DUF1822 family protein [Nostoc sp. FACHB-190]MBD2457732.1 DUF1822 family protein [Nostoc sp. FACHB-87]MBD2478192.1 DUF1822 family protein [Anabaena sp. FACHB-83]